jgi:hypothetical protein
MGTTILGLGSKPLLGRPENRKLTGMPDNRYELVVLGPAKDTWRHALEARVTELFVKCGLDFAVDGRMLVGRGAPPDWSGFPVAVWFGGEGTIDAAELVIMREFLDKGFTLFPVVASLADYSKSVPSELKAINGQQWDEARTSADVMKGFRLARAARQVFISYKRSEGAGVAHQLFNELNERGFRVFLDTASVDAGADFQRALWSRMADVDLVILLDSPTALNSTWVHQELNRAHDLGLGVVQLIWPDHTQTPGTDLSFPIQLAAVDFLGGNQTAEGKLEEAVIRNVVREIEGERIRSLSARRSRLVDGLLEHVNSSGATVSVHPMRNVDILKGTKKIAEVVPFAGVPDSISVYLQERLKAYEPTVLIYNGLGVDPEWAEHLRWLNAKAGVTVHQIDDFGSYIAGII